MQANDKDIAEYTYVYVYVCMPAYNLEHTYGHRSHMAISRM